MSVGLFVGDCRVHLKRMAAEGQLFDGCVTDPPYHLTSIVKRFGKQGAAPAQVGATGAFRRASKGFMGQEWDGGDVAFQAETWRLVYGVLKPGAYLVAYSAPRSYDQLASAIRSAGFDMRDCIFNLVDPDAAMVAFLETLDPVQVDAFLRMLDESAFGGPLAWIYGSGMPKSHNTALQIDQFFGERRHKGARKDPVVREEAKAWEGWGSALKPAIEPIVLARKPLLDSIPRNVVTHGVGALNIDGCKVGDEVRSKAYTSLAPCSRDAFGAAGTAAARRGTQVEPQDYVGRHPANVIHDGSALVQAAFPETPGQKGAVRVDHGRKVGLVYSEYGTNCESTPRGDQGSAARFFYSSKANADDRLGSKHPTVKPVDLMQWLVRLVVPEGGHVLDPFAGSGTTGVAAMIEGRDATLIELSGEYAGDIHRRLDFVRGAGRLAALEKADLADPDVAAAARGSDLPLFK